MFRFFAAGPNHVLSHEDSAMTGSRSDSAPREWGTPRAAVWYGMRAPLALAAVVAFASPAFATGHRTAMPTHKVLAVQPVRASRSAPAHVERVPRSAHTTAKSKSTERHAVASASARPVRGARGMAYTAALHGREAETAHVRAGAKRVGRNAKAATSYALGEQTVPISPHGTRPARAAQATSGEQVESAANSRTSARIHAWYNHQAQPAPAAEPAKVTRMLAAAPRTTLAPVDTATTRKAMVQNDANLAAAEQKEHQTTAADDNADAESHIPSTAPTERVPSPFIHGDSLQPDGSDALPASHSRAGFAPVVRQQPVISTAQLGRGLPPQPQTASRTLASPISPVAALVPQKVDLRGTASLASGTVSAGSPLTKAAPAAATVQANARHPKLDAAVSEGMAEENFDDDGAPATARTAVMLAGAANAGAKKSLSALESSEPLESLASANVNLYDTGGRLLMMAPMKGSHEILVHQNQMALQDGLERVQDDGQLSQMRRDKLLIALPDDDTIYPNDVLPLNRRYARSWTVRFLRDMGRAHYARFGTPLIVTSAVRTVAFQRRLVRVNANAAPPTGDIASPHLYGQAVDIGKRGMSLTELTWMRAYLTPIENGGKIDVEEEFQQACFHISVYRRYVGLPDKLPQRLQVPTLMQAKSVPSPEIRPEPKQERGKRRLPTALLATGLR